MDSGDSLLHLSWLLQESPETLQKLRDRLRHVLVDEFQDINPIQDELLSALLEGILDCLSQETRARRFRVAGKLAGVFRLGSGRLW